MHNYKTFNQNKILLGKDQTTIKSEFVESDNKYRILFCPSEVTWEYLST